MDGTCDFGIFGSEPAEEPAPQLVVFASEQSFERGALGRFRAAPGAVEVALEQLVQLAHAAPAAPAQATQFGVLVHPSRIQLKRAQ